MPERNQTEASPAALLVESRTPQKSFLFLLEEKIGRAQIRKSEENFFVGQCRFPARRRGGFLSSVQSGFAQSLEYPTIRYFQNFLSQTEALPRGFAARQALVPQGGARQNPTARQTKRKPLFASKTIQI
ncbi:MAG TPA: hypothetical protein PK539_04120 [Candidatus Paceibacterota bacterium]|nr:hypothetical protein [Candidatus Paceibacterota bacterium]